MRSRKSSVPEQLGLGLGWRGGGLVAGVDEAGRGPLAGPVVAAAVILDGHRRIRGLADSKQLAPATRERLYDEIRAKALCCSVGEASVEEIDTLNILQATMLAMRRAVEGLRLLPHRVLVDGNRLPTLRVPAEAIVQGDAKVKAISAASILAKVHRDRLCQALHEAHPQYGFAVHKGYSTPEHLAALQLHGACAVHRRSFAPVRLALERAGAFGTLTAAQAAELQIDTLAPGPVDDDDPDEAWT
jgi:ribonuclease HII